MTPLSFLGARSFWALLLSVAAQFVPAITSADVDPLAGHLADGASALLALWAWLERRRPQREIRVLGPLW